jgi:para-aminobenzoate synthetase / 4-amino-4-deoxychorismate lyase
MRTAVFASGGAARLAWRDCFDQPQAVHVAATHAEVLQVIALAEAAALAGRFVAMALSYEAAAAFDPAIPPRAADDFPLAWAAVFDQPATCPESAPPAAYERPTWRPQVSKGEYVTAITKIHQHIAAGDTYQVNYTFPLTSRFDGDAWSWFSDLQRAQPAGYCAYVDLGRHLILSLSPELFFERRGDHLITRPMKGTSRRGRWLDEDVEQMARLRASAKERAENLMIVDLLRNDLGKIAETGSVDVPELFAVERYPTVLQMTSTVTARCKPSVRLADIFRALFPCGSITGAPKLRTMQIIRELESRPRGIYTGTIGLIRPGGDCVFNVAIRTLVLDRLTGEATFGVGGGITFDSTAEAEYEECALKASFLTRRTMEFELLESLLLESGTYFLLERHLERIKASAEYFGFLWNEPAARAALNDVGGAHSRGEWKVRLRCAMDGTLAVAAEPLNVDPERRYRVALAAEPADAHDPLLYHKTTARQAYEQALRQRADCDDVIFWNTRGEITESAVANVVLISDGKAWTPPRASGLLRGTFAAELIGAGELHERIISKDELLCARSFYLINSVRKWMRASLI